MQMSSDAADLDTEGGKKAEKGRARVKTMEEKLIIAGTDVQMDY